MLLVVALSLPAFSASAFAQPGDLVDGMSSKELGVPAGAMPDVTMKAGVLVTEDGRVLWARHENDRRAMASVTKIMTAVVAMENGDLDDAVIVPSAARQVGYPSPFLATGVRATMGELLEALLVKSGNDASIAIAHQVAGDEKRFVAMMNAKAGELGLSGTHFNNAHGLDQQGHYSTASDLAVLARYAMRKPEFRRIVGLQKATIDVSGKKTKVENTNLLLSNYEGANGVKTGWTNDAGYCVVASACRGKTELYAVVLGTKGEQDRFANARELLDWGYAHFREQRLASKGSVLGESVVTDYLDVAVPAAVSEDTTLAVLDVAGEIKRSVTMSEVRAPVRRGDRLGVATFTQGERVVATVPLLAVNDVDKPNLFERLGIAIIRAWRKLTSDGGTKVALSPLGVS